MFFPSLEYNRIKWHHAGGVQHAKTLFPEIMRHLLKTINKPCCEQFHEVSKQSKQIHSATGMRENMCFWFRGELSLYGLWASENNGIQAEDVWIVFNQKDKWANLRI